MTESVNGYSNYETYHVAVWVNNDDALYERTQEMAAGVGNDLDKLADALKQEFTGNIPFTGLQRDLYQDALDRVKWPEVAEAIIDE